MKGEGAQVKPWKLAEAADLLRKSPRAVRMMAQRGAIRPAYKIGGDWIFPPSAAVADDAGRDVLLKELAGL